MKKLLVILMMLIFLSGCGGLCHSFKTGADYNRDDWDCEAESNARANNAGLRGNPFYVGQEWAKCMNLKHGWYHCEKGGY